MIQFHFWISDENEFFNSFSSLIKKDICTPMFVAALFTIAKIWKQPECPSMDKEDVVYRCNRILLYKKLILLFGF